MPTVLHRAVPLLLLYSHEPNEPPHIHVDRGEATIKVWLESLEVDRSRGFRAHEINDIVRMVAEHRARLLEAWHGYFGQDR